MNSGYCPFIAEDRVKSCQNILSGKIDFPHHFSPELCQIVKELLQKHPTKRLGHTENGNRNEIRSHQWFQGFDWSALFQHKLKAPCIPRLIENENLYTNNQTKIKVSCVNTISVQNENFSITKLNLTLISIAVKEFLSSDDSSVDNVTHRHRAKFPIFNFLKNRSSYKTEGNEAINKSTYGTIFEPINTTVTSSLRLFHTNGNDTKGKESISKSINSYSRANSHKESIDKSTNTYGPSKFIMNQ